MANTERTRYKNDWQKEHVDRINLTVPKGCKETIHTHATAHGESVNGFINRAIKEAMEQDRLFDKQKDDLIAHARTYEIPIDEREDFKKLAMAFAALESVIPDIERIYFSELLHPSNRRAKKIFSYK